MLLLDRNGIFRCSFYSCNVAESQKYDTCFFLFLVFKSLEEILIYNLLVVNIMNKKEGKEEEIEMTISVINTFCLILPE